MSGEPSSELKVVEAGLIKNKIESSLNELRSLLPKDTRLKVLNIDGRTVFYAWNHKGDGKVFNQLGMKEWD